MTDMIERVARAICKSRTCEGVSCCEWPANMSRRHKCPVSTGAYDDAARAAIEAMREPNEAMIAAGDSEPTGHSWGGCAKYPGKHEFAESKPIWEAMIDAALQPPKAEV